MMTIDEIKRLSEVKGNRLSANDFRKRQYEWVMAIDPDQEKSGVCLLHIPEPQQARPENISVWANSYSFPEIIDRLNKGAQNMGKDNILIVVEGGWLNAKSCFHEAQGRCAERIAKNVGANHQTGRLLVEMAEHIGFKVEVVKPLLKTGTGKDRKLTNEDLSAYIPNMPQNRINQDARDAIRIAWRAAGLPEDNSKATLQRILAQS